MASINTPKLIFPVNTTAPNAEMLDGIDSSKFAQNSFSRFQVDGHLVGADNATDVIELVPGDNIAIIPGDSEADDKITISVTGKVKDSDKLDGLDSTQFIRSDTDSSIDGKLTSTKTVEADEGFVAGGFKIAFNPQTQTLDFIFLNKNP